MNLAASLQQEPQTLLGRQELQCHMALDLTSATAVAKACQLVGNDELGCTCSRSSRSLYGDTAVQQETCFQMLTPCLPWAVSLITLCAPCPLQQLFAESPVKPSKAADS